MTAVDILKSQADFAFKELLTAVEGVPEGQAWSVLPNNGPDYLHSDGTIHGLVLHMASGKIMYASSCFLDGKYRWRDVADEMEGFEPSWPAAVEFLKKAHGIWMDSWASLSDEDLLKEVPHIQGRLMPTHKILEIVIHHDGWHGGQIALMRYGVGETTERPPSYAEDIRKYCAELPNW